MDFSKSKAKDQDKENRFVPWAAELKNFLEQELNLDEYEPVDGKQKEEKNLEKRLINISVKRVKGANSSLERFKIVSWKPWGDYKKVDRSKEDAKLDALRKVIEKGKLRNT